MLYILIELYSKVDNILDVPVKGLSDTIKYNVYYLNFSFETTVDPHAIVRNNMDRSRAHFTQFSSVVTEKTCITIYNPLSKLA